MKTFITELKEDKIKLLNDAVAELKNASGDTKQPTQSSPPKKEPEAKKEPAKVPTKKPPVKKAGPSKKGPAKKSPTAKSPDQNTRPTEAEISEEVAVDLCSELFGEEITKEVQNSNWKARLEALENLKRKLETISEKLPAQAVLRLLSLKPGFKDTNFQCNTKKLEIIQICGNTESFSETRKALQHFVMHSE